MSRSQSAMRQLAKMSERAKEQVRRMCRVVESNGEIADHLHISPAVVAVIREMMPANSKGAGGKRGTLDRPPPHQREPKYLSEDAIALDLRYQTDAVVGSRMLLVRMLETGKHWLNPERFRTTIDALKNNIAATADPRTDIRRRINSL